MDPLPDFPLRLCPEWSVDHTFLFFSAASCLAVNIDFLTVSNQGQILPGKMSQVQFAINRHNDQAGQSNNLSKLLQLVDCGLLT